MYKSNNGKKLIIFGDNYVSIVYSTTATICLVAKLKGILR